jgi:hypothetical protein
VHGEGQSASSTYENNTNQEDHEQNPWNSSLFDDMQLDEVKVTMNVTIIYTIILLQKTNQYNEHIIFLIGCR